MQHNKKGHHLGLKRHANIKTPYKEGKTMLEFINDVIAKDLGTSAN